MHEREVDPQLFPLLASSELPPPRPLRILKLRYVKRDETAFALLVEKLAFYDELEHLELRAAAYTKPQILQQFPLVASAP